ncbi:MAG TPA: hypothetical protein VF268_16145 [Gammaproteobacteria bacterium]
MRFVLFYFWKYRRTCRSSCLKYQHGAALMLLILLLFVALSAALIIVMSPNVIEENRQLRSQQALEAAKQVLIAYAVGAANRPGELPCPDIDNDGKINPADGVAGNCTSLRGWLPWYLLGLGDLRDGHGERLWYVLSDTFRPYGSAPPGLPLNSDTQTDLVIYGADPANPDVAYDFPQIAAIIIAPGEPLSNNASDRTFEHSENISADDLVASYLEMRNSDADKTTYTKQPASTSFNDHLIIITVDQIMKHVEKLAKRTIVAGIDDYFEENGFYPYAEEVPGDSCDGTSLRTEGYLQLAHQAGCPYDVLGMPDWIAENDWHRMFWYAFDPSCQTDGGNAAPACAGSITVGDIDNIKAFILFSGKAIDVQNRPSDLPVDYFDDDENYDLDGIFQYPVPSATNNDELTVIN